MGKKLFMEHIIEIPAHSSIYVENYLEHNYKERTLRVCCCEPDIIDADTGLLLLIGGYGEHSGSKVYRKMRRVFSEKYNLIVFQCDYFGNQYMQSLTDADIQRIPPKEFKCTETVEGVKVYTAEIKLNESLKDMNDLGVMQAIDNITATLSLIELLSKRKETLNSQKIILYGFSHGAYLGYLCNRFCPGLFQLIIDNSAYVFPVYIDYMRYTDGNKDQQHVNCTWNYMIKNHLISREIYSLQKLYEDFSNCAHIVCFHGRDDELISINEKIEFTSKINKMVFIEIAKEDLDGEVFKSSTHGLDCDYLKLFDFVYAQFENRFGKGESIDIPGKVEFTLENDLKFIIDYKKNFPEIHMNK